MSFSNQNREIIISADSKKTEATPKFKANRLKDMINATFLGPKGFSSKYNFSYGTIKSWLRGLYGGIPPKRATEIVQALKHEKIVCSVEWLINGTGEKPYYSTSLSAETIDTSNLEFTQTTKNREQKQIQKEFEIFRQYYGDISYMTIETDDLYPFFQKGDLLAGINYYEKDIKKTLDKVCIIKTIDSKTPLLRIVTKGTIKNRFTLVSINQNKPSIDYNVEIKIAAPILLIRKPSLL